MASVNNFKVPMSSPDITDAEIQAVLDVMNTRWLSMGPNYQAFEQAICEYSGAAEAIAVNSGTAGLHLCVQAAGLGAGDLVLTTPFSFVASTNVILFENAIPIFVDVDPVTGNMDPVLAKQAVEDLAAGGTAAQKWLPRIGAEQAGKLKAILPIDVFGQPYDADPINKLAKEHDLKIIEDSCEAIGAQYKGRRAGLLGDFGVFAFYPNKQMTTAEGGVIVTNDKDAADYMRALRNQGRAPGDTWLDHTFRGYNYRMDELNAAIGRVQVGRLDEMMEKRARVAGWYAARLEMLDALELPQVVSNTTRMSWFVYVIRLEQGHDRDAFIRDLASRGIPARPYFAPIHQQPYMREQFGCQAGDYPVTEDLGARGVAIPFSSVMTEEQVETVCKEITDLLG